MTAVRTCPACGFPICSSAIAAHFVGRQRKLYEAVASAGAAGIASSGLMEAVYADDPAGGPLSQNVLAVMTRTMNRRLEAFGVAIRGRSGHGSSYRLTALSESAASTTNPRRSS